MNAPGEAAQERDADTFAHRAAPALSSAFRDAPRELASSASLPEAATDILRSRFAFDATPVRLHTDATSASASSRLGARAFTVGSDIYFDRAQFRPDSPEGSRLLAHELAHVGQQRHAGAHVQRSPYAIADGTEAMHRRLSKDYVGESPDPGQAPQLGGLQYTPGYQQWLGAQAANGPQFLPTTFTQKDPLQQHPVAANGLTTYFINGHGTAGLTLDKVISTIQGALTPTTVLHAPGLVTGQVQCRFDPAQRIDSGTHVDELTSPPQGGWKARLPPADVGAVAACPGKATVPVALTDVSGDPNAVAKLVHDSEMEHVAELRALHDRHFVPYARFMRGLTATAGSEVACEAMLRPKLADRDSQAATAFALGDLAATRRYDDPASTHRGTLVPTVSPGCTGVTLTARQVNPPLPGAGPGNVMPVAPQSTAVDPAQLAVNGSTLMSGASVVRVFASGADAATAMGVLATLGVTEILRIGSVEILLAGAQAASGTLQGIPTLAIHPDAYQVTPGVPNVADWVISEMMGAKFFEIANFGNARDDAYAAADLMVTHAIRHQSSIGAAGSPGMIFYTA